MNNKMIIPTASILLFVVISLILITTTYKESSPHNTEQPITSETQEIKSDKWSLQEWLETFPEEKKRSEYFQVLVQEDGIQEEFSESDSVSIAFVVPGIQSSDYWSRSVSAFEARLIEIGLPYTLQTYFSKPGEIAVQFNQIKEVMELDYDFLITTLDESSDQKMIEQIISSGSTKVILQNITTPLRRFTNRQPFLYTGFDHEVGARLLAQQYIQQFPNGGDWVLLLFTDGLVSDQRGGAFRREMEKHPDMNLRSVYLTDGIREKSKESVLKAIGSYESIDFIYSCATDVTVGAIDALESEKLLDSIYLNGWGGGSLELQLIQDNKLNLTVMRMNDDASVAMAEAIKLDLLGKGNQVPQVYSGIFRIVTTADSNSIEQLKDRAFRYSQSGDSQ